jgi:beta-N-acetylglucosaminidase
MTLKSLNKISIFTIIISLVLGYLFVNNASAETAPTSYTWHTHYYNNTTFSGKPAFSKTIKRDKANFELYENLRSGSPHSAVKTDNFATKYIGLFDIPAGYYILRIKNDDGFKILVDGKTVLSNWKAGGYKESAIRIKISNTTNATNPERHRIEVQKLEATANSMVTFTIEPNTVPSDHWLGQIFNNSSFKGNPITIGGQNSLIKHTNLNLNWGTASPSPFIKNDYFTTRWWKKTYLNPGTYKFEATVDDAIRLYVGNTLVINSWKPSAGQNISGQITITKADYYNIRIDHLDNTRSSYLNVKGPELVTGATRSNESGSLTPTTPTDTYTWHTHYYNNTTLSGKPAFSKTIKRDKANFELYDNLRSGSPSSAVRNDNFSARYIGLFDIPAGYYVLRVKNDDGFKILVDGKTVLSNWKAGGYKESAIRIKINNTTNATNPLRHRIEVQKLDATASSMVTFTLEPSTIPNDHWLGQIFNNTSFKGDPIIIGGASNSVNKQMYLNQNWGSGSPSPFIRKDYFTSRWWKQTYFEPGTYQFDVNVDDGVRLYVGNTLVINSWKSSSGQKVSGKITIPSAGNYIVRVDHLENTGSSNINVKEPQVSFNENNVTKYYGLSGPTANTSVDYFRTTFNKGMTLKAGDYFAHIFANNYYKMKLDDKEIIYGWENLGFRTREATLENQAAGTYNLETIHSTTTGSSGISTHLVPFDSWLAMFYSNTNVSGPPKESKIIAGTKADSSNYQLNYYTGTNSPAPGKVKADGYGAILKTYKRMTAGDYNLRITSKSGGFKVFVDGKLIIDQWSVKNTAKDIAKNITLSDNDLGNKGNIHKIEIHYSETSGITDLKVSFDSYINLDLRKKAPAAITAAYLDNYLKLVKPTSPLIGRSQVFINAQEKYGINALFLFSLAIHESGYGLSTIGTYKNNLFGWAAYDSCPYDCAYYFPTLDQNINAEAFFLKDDYLNPTSWKHKGYHLGNKTAGINFYYASDPLWGQKTAAHMERIYPFNPSDYANVSPVTTIGADPGVPNYTVKYPNGIKGMIKASDLNVRSKPSTDSSSAILGKMSQGTVVDVLGRHNYHYFYTKYNNQDAYLFQNVNGTRYVTLMNLGRVVNTKGAFIWKTLIETDSAYFEKTSLTTYVALQLDSNNNVIKQTNSTGTFYKVSTTDGQNIGWINVKDVTQIFTN